MPEPTDTAPESPWQAASRRLLRALRLVRQTSPRDSLEVSILTPIQGLLVPLQLLVLKLVVDALVGLIGGHPNALVTSLGYVAVAGSLAGIGAALQARSRLVTERLSLELNDRVQGLIHAHSITLDLAYSETPEFHDRLHRAQREGGQRSARILQVLVGIARDLISLLAIAGLLLVTVPWAALLTAAAALPMFWVRLRHSTTSFRWRRRRTGMERLATVLDGLLSRPAFAKEIRLLDLGSHLAARHAQLRTLLRDETLALTRERVWGQMWAQVGGALAVFGALGLVVLRVAQRSLALGSAVMCVQALQRAFTLNQSLFSGLADLHEGQLFLIDLEEFFMLRPQILDPPGAASELRPSGSLVLEDVCFRYPGTDRDVLSHVSLEVKAGEVVALVGENGAGKTTLVKLACRLYDPDSGRILLGNEDVRTFKVADLRRAFGVVFQDFIQFPASLHENIAYGDVSRLPDAGAVREAAVWAGADEIAAALPQGFDTQLGRFLEQGYELSIGQWQRLALARARFRDAAVLVLDEPTSALDALAEARLYERLRELLRGKTVVLISHRFSSVAMADRIYVLEHGAVVESGSHEELMRASGHYARMYSAQARPYQRRTGDDPLR